MFDWFAKNFRFGQSPLQDDALRASLQRAILDADASKFQLILRSAHPNLLRQHRLYGVLVMMGEVLQAVMVDETGHRINRPDYVIDANTPIDLLNVKFTRSEITVALDDGVIKMPHKPNFIPELVRAAQAREMEVLRAGDYQLSGIFVCQLCDHLDQEAPSMALVATALRLLLKSPAFDLPLAVAKAALEPHWRVPCEMIVQSGLTANRSRLDQVAAAAFAPCDAYRAYDVNFRTASDGLDGQQYRIHLICAKRDRIPSAEKGT